MAIKIIRFKFRSLLNYESVEIGDRPSISLRDLVLKIIHKKNIDVRQDCDLLFFDALTGQDSDGYIGPDGFYKSTIECCPQGKHVLHEYADNNIMIPSGSAVIIKRLPLGSLPSAMKFTDSFEDCGVKDTKTVDASLPIDVEDIYFDDLGDDLNLPDAILLCSDIETSKKKSLSFEKANNELRRCSGQPIDGSQKHEAGNLIDARLRGSKHSAVERNASEKKCDVKEQMGFGQTAIANPSALQKLRCSLCDGILKDAVIILCCQYSFCERCIHQELVDKARCPRCFCGENEIEGLVPNITLRKLIENNRESLNLIIGPESDVLQYAPDGESGIYPNGVPCGVKILHREAESPHSPTSTGRGSNQIETEPSYELQLRENASMGCFIPTISLSSVQKSLRQSSLSPKMKQIDGDKHVATLVDLKDQGKGLAGLADFQGGSQPVYEKGVGNIFMQSTGQRKGERSCFICGSVDHLIRNCPAASSSDVASQTGNYLFPGDMTYDKLPYRNGTLFPNSAPFMNAYNPQMMAFNPSILHPMAFARPAYTVSMFGSLPPYPRDTEKSCRGGYMRMGGEIVSVKNSMEHHPFCSDLLDLQDCQRPQKFSDDSMRKQDFVGDDNNDLTGWFHRNETERSRRHKSHASQERNEKHKRFRRNTERTQQGGSNSAWIRHPSTKEKDAKRKTNRSESSDVIRHYKKH